MQEPCINRVATQNSFLTLFATRQTDPWVRSLQSLQILLPHARRSSTLQRTRASLYCPRLLYFELPGYRQRVLASGSSPRAPMPCSILAAA